MALSDLAFIDSTGFHYSDYPAFLAYFTNKYKQIYGEDTILTPDSQDGQWIAVEAQAAFDSVVREATSYLSFAPPSAIGAGLSRLVKINGIERESPSHSTVDLTIIGTAGTTITDGIAVDNLNQQWLLPSPITIPGGGMLTETATAKDAGAISALPNTINIIFTPTLGWQTVNNPLGATVGAPVETDGQLRERQKISVANPSVTVFEGTLGAVGNVSGVSKVQGYENDTDSTDSNTLPPHSISVVVEGGLDSDVAAAIQVHKTPGTNTYGTTAVPTTDSRGMPITIRFYRPTPATIGAQVVITILSGWTSDYIPLIQAAVAAFIVDTPIGGTVFLTRLYLSAYLQNTPAFGTFEIVSIELNKNGGSFSAANQALLFNEIALCNPSTDVAVIP